MSAAEDTRAVGESDDGGASPVAAVSVPTVGQRLKAERERLGMSAAKAADGIHLDAWAIDALESDDYARLGPAVYAKGHLKRYADLLRLPSADILAAFDPRASEAPPTEQPGNSLRMPATESAEREVPWRTIAAAGVLLLIVVGVMWWRPWHSRAAVPAAAPMALNEQAAAAPGTDTATPTPTPQAPGTPAATPPAVAPATAVASTPPSTADNDPSAGVGRARLRLTFTSDSWVDVHDAAGRRVFAGNCHAHSVRTLTGAAPLRIHLGAAGGVQMDVNNRPVPIPAQFIVRNASDFAIGADGVVRALAPQGSLPATHPRG